MSIRNLCLFLAGPSRHRQRHRPPPQRRHPQPGVFQRLAASLLAVTFALVGCSPDFFTRLNINIQREVLIAGAASECGPIEVGVLVPDCPVLGACFTSACMGHNLCYGTCGIDRKTCDEQFFQDLIAVCNDGFSITDPGYTNCRYFALTYWAAVAQLGDEAFNVTQQGVCGMPPPPDVQMGSCCAPGVPPVCASDMAFVDCPAADVFIPQFTCEEIDTLLGGCPVPANDTCADRLPICSDVAPTAGLGRCAGEVELERGGGVCDLSAQDCPNGQACLPVAGEVIRCRVQADNRLATSDGPAAGGACETSGVDSFQADVWYEYVPPCAGTLTIRMCEEITYDSMVAVYGTQVPAEACACPTDNANLLECNDDFCSIAQSTSGITLERVVGGACYLIRLGGWSRDGTFEDAQRARSTLDIGVICDEPRMDEGRVK